MADRVVAVVNDEPIFLSELRRNLPPQIGRQGRLKELMQTNLTALINQTLILQEVRRLKIFRVEPAETGALLEALRESYSSQNEFEEDLHRRGMTLEGLRDSVQRRLLVLKFVDYRFRRHTQIDRTQLREYYDGEWSENFRREFPGQSLPDFETVREELERLLAERMINEELERWLEQVRMDADIVIKL